MKKKALFNLLLILLCLCTACESRIEKSFNLISAIDSTPPKLSYIESESPYSVKIVFDEILNDRNHIELIFNNEIITNFNVQSNIVKIFRKDALIAGNKYDIKIKVEDLNGNSTYLDSFVYTKNNNMANVLISEISTKGTTKNCDKVELAVTKSGSLAGIVVSDGFNDDYNDRCTLPDLYVNEGEFIVVSFKDNPDESFISDNKNGLSSNNGCILILDNPSYNAKIIDSIIYSNNKSENSEGFASDTTLKTAKTLVSLGQWENTYPLASGAVDSTCETSTRTINRKYSNNFYFIDSNSCEDFYITVTGGDSFGYENNLEIYNN